MTDGEGTTNDAGAGMTGEVSGDSAGGAEQTSGHDGDQGTAKGDTNAAPEHGYFADLPRGIIISEDDRPIMDGFANAMHAVGAPKEVVHGALGWYQEHVAHQRAEIEQFDNETRAEAVQAMTVKWGHELQSNIGLLRGFLKGLPPGVGDAIANARLEDGRPLLNSPAGLEWLVSLARGTPVPSGQSSAGGQRQSPQAGNDSVDAEIAKIEKTMRENRTAYNRDEALQAKYRALLAQKHGVA